MLEVDFHCHSLFSGCGLHTVIELLTEARRRGLKGLAITDHGPAIEGGKFTSVFFERLGQPVEGIRLLKGIEANPVGVNGKIDLPMDCLKFMDIVLLGLHYTVPRDLGKAGNTKLILDILEKNPFVDVITHPGFEGYELDLDVVAAACLKKGTALELNNSKLLYARQDPSELEALARACAKKGCPVVIGSDTHALQEIGEDGLIREMLKRLDFPGELILNETAERAFEFVEKRRQLKTANK